MRKATPDDVPRLADALARAFDGDPPMQWFLPDAESRVARARGLFDLMLRRVHLERDWCYTTEDVVGGALWVPPGNWRLGHRGSSSACCPGCCGCSGEAWRARSAGWP